MIWENLKEFNFVFLDKTKWNKAYLKFDILSQKADHNFFVTVSMQDLCGLFEVKGWKIYYGYLIYLYKKKKVRQKSRECHNHKKGKRKVQGVPQSQIAALPRPQEEEGTDKSKQAQTKQTYEKH